VYVALLLTVQRHGRHVRGGVKVYVSVRALAQFAGVSWLTVMNALKHLAKAGLVYRPPRGVNASRGPSPQTP
jgi:Mn-dependent DtxR family transcriptional regulator